MLSFNFRGLNSYDDFGVVITKKPFIPMPERRVTYEDIPGRNGSLTVDDGTYMDITITVDCGFASNEFKEKANEIKAWLMGPPDKLIFSDEDDKYYEAQVVNKFDITQSINIIGEFPVVFNCKPFKYSVMSDIITITEPDTIYNIGTIESEPIITIYGSGDVSITVNGNTFFINGLNEYVTVDSPIKNCYKNTELWNNKMQGEFPVLSVGDNQISWAGNIEKIEIIPNWRWI